MDEEGKEEEYRGEEGRGAVLRGRWAVLGEGLIET